MSDSQTQHNHPGPNKGSATGPGEEPRPKTPWSDKVLGTGCIVVVLFFLFCILLVVWFWGTIIFG